MIESVDNLRLHNPQAAIGIMILTDGSPSHLPSLSDRLFDERCIAFLFDGHMDGPTAWECIRELAGVWADAGRSGARETRMEGRRQEGGGEGSSSWWISTLFEGWSSRYSSCSVQ